MSRARITALVLVNWKGVFYERYLLDEHVTALEGSNGAGKTTVMIAAYVVLLPDMTRLRFTNLGESGATGGDRGIWGRLGEAGSPAYAALELAIEGERLLLGVCLNRLSEPTVEPTPFIVSELSPQIPLSELLLVRELGGDRVPELADLRRTVAKAGAQLEVFRATKDYFAALFERGITPLRLTGEEERTKWNDLLKTSMTGGISRALGTELRSFLLREESGLSETLSRMRQNLESCRRTRVEVVESRQVEREISAIYEAGLLMFAAAVHGSRMAYEEARQRIRQLSERIEQKRRELTSLQETATELSRREAELSKESEERRFELSRLETALLQQKAADQLRQQLAIVEAELKQTNEAVTTARATQREKSLEREAHKAARQIAMEAYDRASVGLLNLQAGLEELARRAHAHTQLQRSLKEARELLSQPQLAIESVSTALNELLQQHGALEAEHAAIARQSRDLQARRHEHARAVEAFDALSKALSPLSPTTAASALQAEACMPDAAATAPLPIHTRARALLSRCAELESAATRLQSLERDLQEAKRLAARQAAAKELAKELAASLGLITLSAVEEATPTLDVHEALSAAEAELQALEKCLQPNADQLAIGQRLDELHKQCAALEQRSARFQLAQQAAERLSQVQASGTYDSQAGLLALRDRLFSEQLNLRSRRAALEGEREAMQAKAAELARGAVLYDAELLRIRDELGADLLATRFEDLEPEQARWVEARLGPWVDALVVDDLEAASAMLGQLEHALGTVHLVRAGVGLALQPSPGATASETLVVNESFGARITKLPSPASLGRRARQANLQDMHDAMAAHTAALERNLQEDQRNASLRRDADLLWTQADIWLAGNPEHTRIPIEAEIKALESELKDCHTAQQEARARISVVKQQVDGLRRLLPDSQLLLAPDHQQWVDERTEMAAAAKAARAHLGEVASTRVTLADLIDVLRNPPPDDAAVAEHRERLSRLECEVNRLFRARSALESVISLKHAAAYGDAQTALDTQANLSPALEHQQKSARTQLQQAETAENAALNAWEEATERLQAAAATAAALQGQRDRIENELATLVGHAEEGSEQETQGAIARCATRMAELTAAAQQCVAERALNGEHIRRAGEALENGRVQQRASEELAGPLERRWSALRASASEAGLLYSALSTETNQPPNSEQLWAEAASKRELLLDRISRAHGGDELWQALRGVDDYLQLWLGVRQWLSRRVPAQIADVHDPLRSLERLRDHLDLLEARLSRQEGELRGSSEDVARGIDVQLRRSQGQVRRLNQQLEGIRFGSILGIRIEMRRIERMAQILSALKSGHAQELLFSTSMPIEEALDEIFKRYGGGAKGGGQKLLDYREYAELAVQINRASATGWEPANPTRLSTGEAIGVGAALMMVVLTEWERDASLLGPRHKAGSVRFLFLDEANRLSRDNLGVLFDMCRTLDLQLLVAAPEVARADGNTTYRLVRHTTEDGREEVIVSGRRTVPAAQVEDMPEAEPPIESESSTEVAP